jgi:hypothetical protein
MQVVNQVYKKKIDQEAWVGVPGWKYSTHPILLSRDDGNLFDYMREVFFHSNIQNFSRHLLNTFYCTQHDSKVSHLSGTQRSTICHCKRLRYWETMIQSAHLVQRMCQHKTEFIPGCRPTQQHNWKQFQLACGSFRGKLMEEWFDVNSYKWNSM